MFCLRVPTDPTWAIHAVADLSAVLVDHAHCEMKAASNALSLVMRHPGNLRLVRALTDLARDELDHFKRCTDFLAERGLELGAPPVDAYAAELRSATARLAPSPVSSLTDRLLVGALIEARSCERFKLLIDALPSDTPTDMRAFYMELFACEARHYRVYVDLARFALQEHLAQVQKVTPERELDALLQGRLSALAEAEGRIVRDLGTNGVRATVHG